MSQRTETWDCARCGTTSTRPAARGTRPKWCSNRCAQAAEADRRAARSSRSCITCGGRITSADARVQRCSTACVPRTPGALRAALEAYDLTSALPLLSERSTIEPNGCWTWQGSTRDGYSTISAGQARKYVRLYRLIVAAKHRAPIERVPVHHACANRACVNPEHLQLVTSRENTAEMLARNAYVARIEQLEEALAAIAPDHPALHHVSLTRGAPPPPG